MSNKTGKLEYLIDKIRAFRDARDWKQFHDTKSLAEASVIEASELLELFLWKDKGEIEKFVTDKIFREEISDELADTLMYLLLLADSLDIDIEEAILKKMRKNESKYPVEKAKGNSVKYTKL